MGHPPWRVSDVSQNMAWKATGNAFAVQMLAAVVCPMIDVVVRSGVMRPEGVVPTPSWLKSDLIIRGAYDELCARKRVHDEAEQHERAVKRRHSI